MATVKGKNQSLALSGQTPFGMAGDSRHLLARTKYRYLALEQIELVAIRILAEERNIVDLLDPRPSAKGV